MSGEIIENSRLVTKDLSHRVLKSIMNSEDGIHTGYVDWDYWQHGFKLGKLYLLAARPGMGKTALALDLVKSICCENKQKTAYFALDESRETILKKLIFNCAEIDFSKVITGSFEENELINLQDAADFVGEAPLIIDDTSSIKIEEIEELLDQRLYAGVKLVIIDYLQLINSVGASNTDIDKICRALKNLAEKKNIIIVVLARVGRETENRKEHRPMKDDLRKVGVSPNLFEVVYSLYRDEYYHRNTDEKGIAEITAMWSRENRCGTVLLQWDSECYSFKSRENRKN